LVVVNKPAEIWAFCIGNVKFSLYYYTTQKNEAIIDSRFLTNSTKHCSCLTFNWYRHLGCLMPWIYFYRRLLHLNGRESPGIRRCAEHSLTRTTDGWNLTRRSHLILLPSRGKICKSCSGNQAVLPQSCSIPVRRYRKALVRCTNSGAQIEGNQIEGAVYIVEDILVGALFQSRLEDT